MKFLDRLANAGSLALQSFVVMRTNQSLLLFPLLSAGALLLLTASFLLLMFGTSHWESSWWLKQGRVTVYAVLFLFYVLNYFIVVFFNTALLHCARLYFRGEAASIAAGIRFACHRLPSLFAWSLLAATVGTLLRMISDNAGWPGKLATGLLGVAWSLASFFAVPVLAYENRNPVAALKRSVQLMRQKWGESLGATFSFGLLFLLLLVFVVIPLTYVSALVHPVLALGVAITCLVMLLSLLGAVETLFQSAVYHSATGEGNHLYSEDILNGLFESKSAAAKA